jgi:hypothetical protein
MSDNNMSAKDVIQSKKRAKRSPDEDEQNEKFNEQKRKKLISTVTEDVEALGDDLTTLQTHLQLSDQTLGKVQTFFDTICTQDLKTDEYYIQILEIHSKLSPCLGFLSNFSKK